MRLIWIIFYLLLIALGISFAVLNSGMVSVNLYVTTWVMPVSVLIILTLSFGLVCGFLLFQFRYWRLKVALLKVKNQLKMNEKEIKNLRDIPLKDQH